MMNMERELPAAFRNRGYFRTLRGLPYILEGQKKRRRDRKTGEPLSQWVSLSFPPQSWQEEAAHTGQSLFAFSSSFFLSLVPGCQENLPSSFQLPPHSVTAPLRWMMMGPHGIQWWRGCRILLFRLFVTAAQRIESMRRARTNRTSLCVLVQKKWMERGGST